MSALLRFSRRLIEPVATGGSVRRKRRALLLSTIERTQPVRAGSLSSAKVHVCHMSTTISTPVSRKKKNSASTLRKKDEVAVPVPVSITKSFTVLAHEGIAMIDAAISPLIPMNPGYKLRRTGTDSLELDCGSKVGKYMFGVDYEEERITYQSPLSGNLEYMVDDEDGGVWLNARDGHDMRGIITRDLLRHAAGLCKF